MGDGARPEEDERDDPASGPQVHDLVPLPGRDEVREEDRIDGETVTGLGLDQPEPAVHELVDRLVRSNRDIAGLHGHDDLLRSSQGQANKRRGE